MNDAESRWQRSLAIEIAAGTATLGLSVLAHRLVPLRFQVPAGMAAGGLAVVTARALGITWQELGLSPRDAPRGALIGTAAAAVLGAVTAAGLLIPAARRFYLDDRIVRAGVGQVVREVFVRIPLATALPEELVFRGAMFGLIGRRRSPLTAAFANAALFGLWHILPAIDRIESNPGTRHTRGDHLRVAAVVSVHVVVTTAAGLGFSWLRFRSRSVLAPTLAHIAPNAAGFLGGWAVARLTSPGRDGSRPAAGATAGHGPPA